jgi:hypothetical protein
MIWAKNITRASLKYPKFLPMFFVGFFILINIRKIGYYISKGEFDNL